MTTVNVGAVAPFVKDVAEMIAEKFPEVISISGWRATAGDMNGHPAGLALDIVVGPSKQNQLTGKLVWNFLDNNAAKFHVKYTIYMQTYKEPGKPGSLMERRGGDKPGYDPNHLRHVHVSFLPIVKDGRRLSASGVNDSGTKDDTLLPDSVENVVGTAKNISEALTDRNTWIRVGKVVGGAALIYFGALVLMRDNLAAAVGAATDVIPQAKVAKTAVKATAAATSPSTS